jgi:glycerol transport system substrate-binding protein
VLSFLSGAGTRLFAATLALGAALAGSPAAVAAELPVIERWIQGEFSPSTLSEQDRRDELAWFRSVAGDLRGVTIKVATPDAIANDYEARILTRAFEDITGIAVEQSMMPEDERAATLVDHLAGRDKSFAAIIAPLSLDTTPEVIAGAVDLRAFMAGEGKTLTNPRLDPADLVAAADPATPPVRMLPNLLVADAYWFRRDLFADPGLGAAFKARFGYDLGVPLNWTAYGDIAAFFSDNPALADAGVRYGHAALRAGSPDLAVSFATGFLPLAGAPDALGLRFEGCRPAGASMTRGGSVDAPVAAYAVATYRDWLRLAPSQVRPDKPQAVHEQLLDGTVAQALLWPTDRAAEFVRRRDRLHTLDGSALWGVAPLPVSAYATTEPALRDRSTGWLLFSGAGPKEQQAAWLYAQFTVAKSVTLRKSLIGLAFSRRGDLAHPVTRARDADMGGLFDLYRAMRAGPGQSSTARALSPTLVAALAPAWTPVLGADAATASGPVVLGPVAQSQDATLARLAASTPNDPCAPLLNPVSDAESWFAKADAGDKGAPRRKLANEAPAGRTMPYDAILDSWRNAAPQN